MFLSLLDRLSEKLVEHNALYIVKVSKKHF